MTKAAAFEKKGVCYFRDRPLIPAQVAALYDDAGLVRPTGDLARIESMLAHANLLLSAWKGEELVGVARCLTDFSYCCYLSDLAVKKSLQRVGIGRTLMDWAKEIVGPQSMLLLLSVPSAMDYYPRCGFEPVSNGFIRKRET